MSTEIKKQGNEIKSFFENDNVKNKFSELLGKRAPQFITSVLQIVNSNDMLKGADVSSIYNSAILAATLDLPINNNLGFAYLIPFNQKQKDNSYKVMAQFQLGYKGVKQLALRSGQFITMHSTDVKEGEIVRRDRLTGEIEFNWIQDEDVRLNTKTIGYVSFFKLINGYSQTYYMTVEELKAHGLKYSQTFKKGYGLWKDDYHSMCMKTVTKLNLSKNAPLSVEMQKAVLTDQAVINDEEATDITYVDNEVVAIDKGLERLRLMINEAKSIEELDRLFSSLPEDNDELNDLWLSKKEEISRDMMEGDKGDLFSGKKK